MQTPTIVCNVYKKKKKKKNLKTYQKSFLPLRLLCAKVNSNMRPGKKWEEEENHSGDQNEGK